MLLTETGLRLTPAPLIRGAFCGVDTVVSVTGKSTEQLYDLVDSGHYLWAWDVSAGKGHRRELRFWSAEILANGNGAAFSRLTLDQVIRQIVPERKNVPGQFDGMRQWEFGLLLRLDRQSLVALRDELRAVERDGRVHIPRPAIVQFLTNRWLGKTILASRPLQRNLL